MTPSSYQTAIYDAVIAGRGDLAVSAVAGSGKTTTLIEVSKRLHTSNALFLAFNKAIVDELQSRLGQGVTCKTLNALGHNALARGLGCRLSLDAGKYGDIIADLLRNIDVPKQQFGEALKAMRDLVSLAQSSLIDPHDLDALLAIGAHHGVDIPEFLDDRLVGSIVQSAMETGEQLGRRGIISFDDQIWLPHRFSLRPMTAEWVLVDEAQDLSAAKLELALSARAAGGRMLFVGDPAQAIYGFAGADCNSFENIVKRTNATVLPLSVCYRCPTSVIAEAKTIVPQIEAAPNAATGEVTSVKPEDLVSQVRTGDLILCRLNAPLIATCIKLIAAKVPARVRGRDIGKSLVAIAKDALGTLQWEDLDVALDCYRSEKSAALAKRKNSEAQIVALLDKIEGVRAISLGFGSTSLEEFAQQVDSLFGDGTAAVELSSVHRAKGLEAERVFIIEPDRLPLSWKGQKGWEATQEWNLRYVAITRAKHSLFIVGAFAAPLPKPAPRTHDEFVQQLPELTGIRPFGAPVSSATLPATPVAVAVEEKPSSERFACSCSLCGAAFVSTHRERICRSCGARAVQVKAIEGKLSDTPCDGRCHNARGHECICSCAGRNHGRTWLTGFAPATSPLPTPKELPA